MPAKTAASRSASGRLAALSRSRTSDDPDLLDARRDLAAARIEEHVAAIVAAAPPLTDEQRDRIVVLLRPATSPAEGTPAPVSA